jgi:asparagine synthase (glutamine-hydrolysing)
VVRLRCVPCRGRLEAMRLICGLFNLDGTSVSGALLRAMAQQMDVPRLRPALRLWCSGSVGLALLDFAARGESSAALPGTGTSTIAADARLDDLDTLRRRVDRDTTDGEDVLLSAALDRFGPAGLGQVFGDFAFARWNGATQQLTCARDVFGIRPLAYVYQPGQLFAFASFPQALHGSGIVPLQMDEAAVARRVLGLYRFDDSLTVGIKRLPPAHVIEVSRARVVLTRYWHLDRSKVGTRKISPARAAGELREAVDRAVGSRLARTGETGAHLSGGLDSSAIAVLAARRLRTVGRTLHAYSFLDRVRDDIPLEDEAEFVNAVLAQEADIDWTPIPPPRAPAARGEPVDTDKMWPLRAEEPDNAVCARAEEQGVRLILSGWGGDEAATFNGRGALAELFRRGRWLLLAREVAGLKRERGWRLSRILYGEIAAYLLPRASITLAKRLFGDSGGGAATRPRLLSADMHRKLADSGDRALALAPDGRENRWRLMTHAHIAERTEVWAQIGARHGLAFAFPLLDRGVVELALSLPSELCVRDGFRRRPFRDAMADVLPARVRLRHEKYLPFPGHMLELAESRSEFLARIGDYELNESVSRLLDLKQLRRLVEEFPTPEHARERMRNRQNLRAPGSMIAVALALKAAGYIEQHHRMRRI